MFIAFIRFSMYAMTMMIRVISAWYGTRVRAILSIYKGVRIVSNGTTFNNAIVIILDYGRAIVSVCSSKVIVFVGGSLPVVITFMYGKVGRASFVRRVYRQNKMFHIVRWIYRLLNL